MPLKQSEAIVLRSYPMREADLLVTFFTRAEGKLRGVAKSAKKSKKRFGGALEPLTLVNVYWEAKERSELTRIDSCDVIASPLTSTVDYPRAIALGYIAEMLDQLLPDGEANDALFRLATSVLPQVQAGAIWMPLTYFDLWVVRLTGLLPELHACLDCGVSLDGERAYFHALADGLMCVEHKRLASSEMSWESRKIAAEMFRSPIENFAGEAWPRSRCADLRKFLTQRVERQLEKKLTTAVMLERVDS
jgi:DNA repair protein RecO (recombination protein O)